ncbi:MAG: hypothetical protein GX442_05890 [Candidatus Riflebacteria bacterium]|nr:hypothetical protein [Candidatus Riflebacteria bacterium]
MPDPATQALEDAVADSVAWLASPAVAASLARDAYWPKWHSPWWHIVLLWEMGLTDRIPRPALQALFDRVRAQYLDRFPFRVEDVPAGTDPLLGILCHCALGTLYQVFFCAGFDVDADWPWARPWLLRYQLPDGGLNCDEAAYLKAAPKSSIVSTLPCLEAVLHATPRPFTPAERAFLDRGAAYLIAHRLFRSASHPDRIIDESWKQLCFPRFYEYDVLRGLAFLKDWAARTGQALPTGALTEAETIVRAALDPASGEPVIGRSWHPAARTHILSDTGKIIGKEPASTFPLLERVRQPGQRAPWLAAQAARALAPAPERPAIQSTVPA